MQSNYNQKKIKVTHRNDGVIVQVKVIPGSSKSEISGIIDEAVKIKLNSPPIEGKANKECIALLSKLLRVPKTSIEVVSGEKSKYKSISIKGIPDEIEKKLNELL